jgi:hypothetical protein
MVRSTAWDPSDPEDLLKNALFPDIPDIYAHKASKPLHETELNYLEKCLRTHEEIPADLVDEWMPRLIWEVREARKKAKEG